MPSTDRLHEFVSIVDNGSIAAAARELELPRATLSRRLSSVEQELGVRLLHRGSRHLVLTPAGEALLVRARRITRDTDDAWASVRRLDDTPRGRLRVSMPSVTDPALFVDLLREFPELEIEVLVSSRHVDLVAEGVDVAVRIGEIRDENLIARRVGVVRSVVVGSPCYLDERGRPRRASDLEKHDCIVAFDGTSRPMRTWPRLRGGSVPVCGRLSGNAFPLIHAAALAGQGLALLPRRLVKAELRTGALEAVLEKTVGTRVPISIVFPDREYLDAKVRVFVDRASAALAKGLIED